MHVLDKALGPAVDRDQGYVGYNDGPGLSTALEKTVRQICDLLVGFKTCIYWREAAAYNLGSLTW